MKTIKFLSLALITGHIFVSCSKDDDPKPINEEETITTMIVTLTPKGEGDAVTLQSKDLDGNSGPNPPEVTVSGPLAKNTTYDGTIQLLNETETPAENITKEVKEEGEEHQFFFETTGSITNVTPTDKDEDGNPIGLAFTLTTGAAGEASLTITLRHEPKKPNNSTLADAGGETDITQLFNLTID